MQTILRAFILYSPGKKTKVENLRTTFAGLLIGMAVWLLAASASTPVAAQSIPKLSKDAYVSVLTILPGKPMYSAFGHTAFRVRDDSLGIDAVYNFGTFDFDTDWFYLKFARGLLDYRLARNRGEDVLAAYTQEERPIIEQRLALDEQELRILVLRLEENYLPENRFYRYDFIFDNCSTRPRDVIETVVGDRALGSDQTGEDTFRELIAPYIQPRPWTHFGVYILSGSLTDRPATARERLFLPDELLSAVDLASVDGRKVALSADTLFWPRGYEHKPSVTPLGMLFGPLFLLTALLIFGFGIRFSSLRDHAIIRYFDVTLFGIAGLAGVVITFLWFGTLHTVTGGNWNILWALPTHLAAAVVLFRERSTRLTRAYFRIAALACAGLLVSWPLIAQDFHRAIIPLALLLLVRAVSHARTRKDDLNSYLR